MVTRRPEGWAFLEKVLPLHITTIGYLERLLAVNTGYTLYMDCLHMPIQLIYTGKASLALVTKVTLLPRILQLVLQLEGIPICLATL